MYQIFYIDIDEEITSIIDRLRKSKTTENFFVVSPRALLLQSVVSLKLLRKEAERAKKQIAVVVNDQEAKVKIEKSGILALSSLKGLEGGEEVKENFASTMEIKDTNKSKNKNIMEKGNKKTRLQKIGSEDFFSTGSSTQEVLETPISPAPSVEKPAEPKMEDFSYQRPPEVPKAPEISRPPIAKAKPSMDVQDFQRESTAFSYLPEKNIEDFPEEQIASASFGSNKIDGPSEMDPYKEKLVEGFFNPASTEKSSFPKENISNTQKEKEKSVPVSHKMKKIIFSFLAVCVVVILGTAAYLFLPKAKITVSTRDEIKKVDFEVKGNSSETEIKTKELSIPARVFEKEDYLTNNFKATGKKNSASSSSSKAKGKVTIYNEYNKESQQLVATTRILSGSGKLFRLTRGVNVPGMTDSGPGKVEAEVIADQIGEEYNIEPSDFKIPGFEGSPKYDKFYAKSTEKMAGGGVSGDSGGVTIVSQMDVDNAKKDSELKLKEKLIDEIKSELGASDVILNDAVEVNISESSASSRVNEVSNNFEYKIKGKAKAIIFAEGDLKKIIGEIYNEANKEKSIADFSLIKVSYGISSADFGAGTVGIKLQAEIPVSSKIDWDEFKINILGKNEDQIKEILKNYPQIEKINIDFWPEFMSGKVPQYKGRVDVEVSK